MLIAVMSDRPLPDGIVPDTFEKSPCLILWETDTDTPVEILSGKTPEENAAYIVRSGAEAVVCGVHIGKACFEPIADACVSRYDGAGLAVPQAAQAALRGTIPLIPEYEGGPGCGSGRGECTDHCH